MEKIIHTANSRGGAEYDWLKTRHTFSFADYYDPTRMNFGDLRVLNDDTIAEGKGFPTHPHQNMEIVTIPLSGALAHKDSMGNTSVIKTGDVQIMSAGTGVTHSEFNHSKTEPVTLLQIWILPDQKNITPRYDQKSFSDSSLSNQFKEIVTPNKEDQTAVWINQEASFYLGKFNNDAFLTHKLKSANRGLYIFVIKGSAVIVGEILSARDGMGVWDTDQVGINVKKDSFVLLIETPL